MPNIAKTLTDYRRLAREKGMRYLGRSVPATINDAEARWRCLRCGRVHVKSYHALKYFNPCRCLTEMQIQPAEYKALARLLAIHWIGPQRDGVEVPATGRTQTWWEIEVVDGRGPHVEAFEASYYELRTSTK